MANNVVYAVPYQPTAPVRVPSPWPGVRHTWTGWDGSVWEISDYYGGVFLGRGVGGLNMPEYEIFRSESGSLDGSRHRGSRAQERTVPWPINVWSDQNSVEWLRIDSAFWRTMDPDKQGRWTVRHPSGTSRYMLMRFSGDGNLTRNLDPAVRGWEIYPITMVANDPYWFGASVSREFAAPAAGSFFPGPPFVIGRGSTTASAYINNLGDVPAWLTWSIVGPSTTATVGIGARFIEVPFAVAAGKSLIIDTNPKARTAIEINTPAPGLDNAGYARWIESQIAGGFGINKTTLLGAVKFGSVPPATLETPNAQLSITFAGGGLVRADLITRYRRPW